MMEHDWILLRTLYAGALSFGRPRFAPDGIAHLEIRPFVSYFTVPRFAQAFPSITRPLPFCVEMISHFDFGNPSLSQNSFLMRFVGQIATFSIFDRREIFVVIQDSDD
jgi:hypothetical protein